MIFNFFRDVLKNNLDKGIILSNSKRHQAIVCSLIADVNLDTKNEILIGTRENVIYNEYFTFIQLNKNKLFFQYVLHYIFENNKWIEQPQFDIRHSVYNICYLDITGEGVNDLVVMSERGIHILKVSYLLQ